MVMAAAAWTGWTSNPTLSLASKKKGPERNLSGPFVYVLVVYVLALAGSRAAAVSTTNMAAATAGVTTAYVATASDMTTAYMTAATMKAAVAEMAATPMAAVIKAQTQSIATQTVAIGARVIGIVSPIISIAVISIGAIPIAAAIISGIDAVRRAARKKRCHRNCANHCCYPFHRRSLLMFCARVAVCTGSLRRSRATLAIWGLDRRAYRTNGQTQLHSCVNGRSSGVHLGTDDRVAIRLRIIACERPGVRRFHAPHLVPQISARWRLQPED
jgi:hypothetical protein